MKKITFFFVFLFTIVSYSFAGWVIETVDSNGTVGYGNSIALDNNNHPHISYSDFTNGNLKYAQYNGSNWQIATLDSMGAYGARTSLVLDNNNNPQISYFFFISDNTGHLKYARYNGSSWQISNVDSTGSVGEYNSIDLDSSNNPCIAYWAYIQYPVEDDLKYARYDGSQWQVSTIDSDGYVGSCTSMKIGSNDNVYISYHIDTPSYDLKFTRFDGEDWQISTVDSTGNVGWGTSIALDNNSNPHISYYKVESNALKYAYYDGVNWQISVVDSEGGFFAAVTSIALDSDNNPCISYYDDNNRDLKYAKYFNSTWYTEIVDSAGEVGAFNSIALDSSGNPHISYSDYTNYDLKYAYWIDDSGVSLLSFSAQPQPNSSIKLVWQVAASDDTQIVGFNLYRSGAGKAHKKDWTRLNSSPIAPTDKCQYVDAAVQAGQGYHYRLSALSTDGKEEMLGTTQGEAGVTPAQFALIAVYPNPARTLLTCRLTMPQAGSVSLGLYDISGRLVLSKRMELASGEQEAALEVGNLARGIYTVRATSSGESVTKRIVVMR